MLSIGVLSGETPWDVDSLPKQEIDLGFALHRRVQHAGIELRQPAGDDLAIFGRPILDRLIEMEASLFRHRQQLQYLIERYLVATGWIAILDIAAKIFDDATDDCRHADDAIK